MLGNYEEGNSFQYTQYDGTSRDQPLTLSYGHLGRPSHKDDPNPSFQSLASYGSIKALHTTQQSKNFHAPSNPTGHDAPDQKKTDRRGQNGKSWADSVFQDLTPPADPLSPLHSSDSEQEMRHRHDDDLSLSPERNTSTRSIKQPLRTEAQLKETGGDLPLVTSQSFPPPLSSKPNLANSRKPTALVRPIPETFHEQTYEILSDLKQNSRPNLPPLKMPPQSVEVSVNIL